jgi:hypothetical protein
MGAESNRLHRTVLSRPLRIARAESPKSKDKGRGRMAQKYKSAYAQYNHRRYTGL